MENKQKPSRLFLVQSHHHLETPGIEFTEEMLDWPFGYIDHWDQFKESKDYDAVTYYRNAFQALKTLPGMTIKVAMEANLTEKRFLWPHRTWGVIHITDTESLTFSHDTRHSNYPFTNLSQWPQLHEIPCGEDRWKEIGKILAGWSIEEWELFFRSKILERSESLMEKACKKRIDAEELEQRSRTILKSLL